MEVPGDGGRRPVQPAAELHLPLQVDGPVRAAASALRPVEPTDRRRDHHHGLGRRRAVHRPGRDRLHRPRPIQDRGALPARQAMDGGPSSGAVRPQAADLSRRQLRRRVSGRHRAGRNRGDRARRARARFRDHVDRARSQRAQLQPRDPGGVARDDEGAPDRALRDASLHDRNRLLGGLAHAAMGRQRVPRHLPGDPADVLLPRRLEHRDPVPRLPPAARLLQRAVDDGGRA